jgi:hypothetical protein
LELSEEERVQIPIIQSDTWRQKEWVRISSFSSSLPSAQAVY